MDERPQARTEGIVTERVDDELVIYDQASHMAHCLSAEAASVWERCDGQRSPEDIGRELVLEPAEVVRALHELSGCGLLDDGSTAEGSYSRREAAVRFAKVGAAAFSAPLIYSVAIAPATAAASGCVNSGTAPPGSGCTALPGSFGGVSTTYCCTGGCYQGATNGEFYCVPAPDGCYNVGHACGGPIPCCATGFCVSGQCTQ